MPVLQRPDGEIHYQQYGRGYPIPLYAPGGMRARRNRAIAPRAGVP